MNIRPVHSQINYSASNVSAPKSNIAFGNNSNKTISTLAKKANTAIQGSLVKGNNTKSSSVSPPNFEEEPFWATSAPKIANPKISLYEEEPFWATSFPANAK